MLFGYALDETVESATQTVVANGQTNKFQILHTVTKLKQIEDIGDADPPNCFFEFSSKTTDNGNVSSETSSSPSKSKSIKQQLVC